MKSKIAIYYVIVVFANIVAAMTLDKYLRVNIFSVFPALVALGAFLDVTKTGKKLDIGNRLMLVKYSRKSKDPTDLDGDLSYDKEKFNSLYEGRNEREKKLVNFANTAELIILPLFITPVLFFSPVIKIIVTLTLYYAMILIYSFFRRKIMKEILEEERAREREIEKELEEQKKREELGKWK